VEDRDLPEIDEQSSALTRFGDLLDLFLDLLLGLLPAIPFSISFSRAFLSLILAPFSVFSRLF
jgi:hypothetical protein